MTCVSTNSQPDVCGHGNVCTSADTCEVVNDGTCSNIMNATSRPAFVPGVSTGAVIFNVVDEAANDDTFCLANQTAFTFTVYAYAAQGTSFPATGSGLQGFFYYQPSGTAVSANSSFRPGGYTQYAGGAMASIKVTLCSATVVSSLQVGLAFTNGNGSCATIFR